jgi:hypothetical protein
VRVSVNFLYTVTAYDAALLCSLGRLRVKVEGEAPTGREKCYVRVSYNATKILVYSEPYAESARGHV